jgi:hypothetical protein
VAFGDEVDEPRDLRVQLVGLFGHRLLSNLSDRLKGFEPLFDQLHRPGGHGVVEYDVLEPIQNHCVCQAHRDLGSVGANASATLVIGATPVEVTASPTMIATPNVHRAAAKVAACQTRQQVL